MNLKKRALSRLKVVEYSNNISGAYCTKILADLGAEVIKVEEPSVGDEARSHGPFPNDIPHPERSGLFLYLNTNKLGITLNVRASTGKGIFHRLLKEADIFVENNPPSLMKKLKLTYTHIKRINKRIIMVSITPFGQTGPYRDYKAYDINSCAAGGVSVGIGDPQGAPLTMPLSIGAYQAGASAAAASLTALLARDKYRKGQHIDISEVEVWIALHTAHQVARFLYQGVCGLRQGHQGDYFLYPNTTLPCKDGFVVLVAPQLQQWLRFVKVMGNPEWTKDPRYRDRRAMAEQYPDEADNLLTDWLMSHTKDEIFEIGRRNHIPFAPVHTIDKIVNDEHFKQREVFLDIKHPEAGTLKYPAAPYKFSKTACRIKAPAPLLGQHNEEIFCKRLGYSKEDLVKLRRVGVI